MRSTPSLAASFNRHNSLASSTDELIPSLLVQDILAGIDDIDWPQLKHAYGAASDTPGHLLAGATSLLEETVDRDDRLVYNGGWRGIAEDDEAADLARAAVRFIKP